MLSPITNLTRLDLGNNPELRDIGALKTLKNLVDLRINNTPISDFQVLTTLKSLEAVDLSDTPIRDIHFLTMVESLKAFDVVNTQISDESIYELFIAHKNREELIAYNSKSRRIDFNSVPQHYKEQIKKELTFDEQVETAKEILKLNKIIKK